MAPSRVIISTAPCCTKKLLCKKYVLLKKTTKQPKTSSSLLVHQLRAHYYTVPLLYYCCNLMSRMNGKKTHTHTHPPREDQCEWHRMTRMTGPDCVVMCNLINTHTHMACTYCQKCCDTSVHSTTAVCIRTAVNALHPQNSRRHVLYVLPILQQRG